MWEIAKIISVNVFAYLGNAMPPSEYKRRYFESTIILWCLRWYNSTGLSYANVSDMVTITKLSNRDAKLTTPLLSLDG